MDAGNPGILSAEADPTNCDIGRRMKMNRSLVVFGCVVLLTAAARTAIAQHAALDPITDNLFAPDLLIRHADEVGLDETQKDFIISQARENRQRYVEMQQNLQHQMMALRDIMRQEHPDEQEALGQLDKVLAGERDIKRAQLSMALAIRGKLTPEQQAKARELRQKYASEMHQQPDSIRAKVQQLQEHIQKLQAEGRDVSAATQAVQQCRQLMQDGKPREAEAALDRAIAGLQAADKN
jgi:Spy/CpxP family protein refolding chaperone